ncbi:M48 family peptidase [Bizionia argentinensis JUB59]|uniref:M48 family peptidase n=1 Tax=Bizionia argentinensis JUB59 TaxID=1046627 RepID=G2ED26_9FLAO|nr:SprT family zinc-dependent metalloprotease [Bizionia argentinensis]EGV43653.1 M48 family peptidase [Bizionia argentinensis JUB59]
MIVSGIDIVVQKSKRKTVSIFIERDGSVSARVPEKLSDEEIKEILKAKEYQIFKNLAEWTQLNENVVEREYVNGQSFLYLGRNYRLKLVEDKLKGVQFIRNTFLLNKADKHKAKELFVKFYKDKLSNKIQPIVERYKGQLGVEPNDIKVMELQNRWASCTPRGNVNFHWKCAMAPIDVLHYIVVHELAHLIHINHSSAFWNEVDKILPNYEDQVNWLKINGVGMDL